MCRSGSQHREGWGIGRRGRIPVECESKVHLVALFDSGSPELDCFEVVDADLASFVQIPAWLAEDRLGVTPAALGPPAE
jgi:hypothetical protein